MIVHRGTLIPDGRKDLVLSSLEDDKCEEFSALLSHHLELQGLENVTNGEMMDVVWEELTMRASEFTLRGNLRSRDVACILKIRYNLKDEIDLEIRNRSFLLLLHTMNWKKYS